MLMMDSMGTRACALPIYTNYRLVHALVEVDEQEYTTWLCVSKDYRKLGETNVSLEIFHDLMREGRELPLDFCKRMGWGRQVAETMLVDFLIGNMDRHGSNTEVLMDKNGNLSAVKIVKLAWEKDPETGRMNMKEIPDSEQILEAQIVLIAAGFLV